MRRQALSRFSGGVGLIGFCMLVAIVGCAKDNSGEFASPAVTASVSAVPTTIGTDSPAPSGIPEALPTDNPIASAEASTTPPATIPNASPAPSKGSNSDVSSAPQTRANSPKPEQPDPSKRQEIERSYESKFSSIRSSCQAKVSNLTGEVTSYIAGAKSGDGEVSIADLQKKFLGKVAAAEASCDKQFNSTLAQAEQAYKDAGVVDTKLSTWKSEYDSGKSQARLSAMSKILAAWQAE